MHAVLVTHTSVSSVRRTSPVSSPVLTDVVYPDPRTPGSHTPPPSPTEWTRRYRWSTPSASMNGQRGNSFRSFEGPVSLWVEVEDGTGRRSYVTKGFG